MPKITQPEVVRRPYHSPARRRQAEETRQRILAVTRELFASRGYVGTTLEAIAEAAGISPKTISVVFGSKRAILAEVVNPGAFGPRFQHLIEELRATSNPAWRLSLVAQIARQAYEPIVLEYELLRTAPGVAPELAVLAHEIETRRRQNQDRLAEYLDERHLLREGLTRELALDIVWTLTSYDVYRLLVVESGWQPLRYEAWLADLLVQQLLPSMEG